MFQKDIYFYSHTVVLTEYSTICEIHSLNKLIVRMVCLYRTDPILLKRRFFWTLTSRSSFQIKLSSVANSLHVVFGLDVTGVVSEYFQSSNTTWSSCWMFVNFTCNCCVWLSNNKERMRTIYNIRLFCWWIYLLSDNKIKTNQ